MIDDSFFELRGRRIASKAVRPGVAIEEFEREMRYFPEPITLRPMVAQDELNYMAEKIIAGLGIPREFVDGQVFHHARGLAAGMAGTGRLGGAMGIGNAAAGALGGIAGAAGAGYGQSVLSPTMRQLEQHQAMQQEAFRQAMMAMPQHIVVPKADTEYDSPAKEGFPSSPLENMKRGFPVNLKRLEELFEDWKMR